MSATEEELLPSAPGEGRKSSSRIMIIALVLAALLVVGAVAWWTVNLVNSGSERTGHRPITIITNSEFKQANGVVGGSGTESDPYIIADWDIDASTGTGIWIEDTDAHFTISNCYVHDGYGDWSGIILCQCHNGTLSNNICSGNFNGIAFDYDCSNNTIANNTCISNSHTGIAFTGSHNLISNNTCSSNGFDGIYLVLSTNNSLMDNNCSSNGHDGISLDRSSDNEVVMNLLSNNAGYGVNISSYLYLSDGRNNRILTNTFIGNNGATTIHDPEHAQACDDGIDNRWNFTDILNQSYGNYWDDWTTPDIVSPFSRVDLPYDILGSAGAKDYYPLTFDPRTFFLI